MKLRDRDAILTNDGFIFRVYGYLHPSGSYVCDPEYASPQVFRSTNSRARRGENEPLYYKFFADEGMKLILNKFPQYTVFYEPLQKCLVGVNESDVAQVRKPEVGLEQVLAKEPSDALLKALHDLFGRVCSQSGLNTEDFGVFGSLLHGFYHPNFSDLDFIVYGKENMTKLCNALEILYREDPSLRNEFDHMKAVESKDWKFVNYSLQEYVWHQRRKMIYAYFDSKDAGRVVKAEFEPVKCWAENVNEFNNFARISHVGWIKAVVEITDDKDAPFIPSVYQIEVKDILKGPKVEGIKRIFSYMEEFRMQAKQGETLLVEGNLEKVVDGTNIYHQITLSYGPRYYEQTLKVINLSQVSD
ncbi:MAG: nucleotidyltransferase domain-containing protein [Candidatus Bathyarchaeota archaeon]|nr:nucleotidyltransferase domain-containing protein [Candidatus Bathyarchaeum sp.]